MDGISQLLLVLAQDVLGDFFSRRIGSLYVVSAGFEGVGHFEPMLARVLPIEALEQGQPLHPSPYVAADYLMAVAAREYMYITLYEILLDALAAEHGMRLMATESALDWLDSSCWPLLVGWPVTAAKPLPRNYSTLSPEAA